MITVLADIVAVEVAMTVSLVLVVRFHSSCVTG